MSEEYGSDYITITDEDGESYELEHLDTFEFEKKLYMAFLPADLPENDPRYGLLLLRVEEEDGEDGFVNIEDEDELNRVYDHYMQLVFDDSDEELPED